MYGSRGRLVITTPANPGAGAELIISVPAGKRWLFISLRYTLVTAVAAANRITRLTFDDAVPNIFCAAPVAAAQVASLTRRYSWTTGDAYQTGPALADTSADLLAAAPVVELAQTWRIRTVTDGIQAADQISAAVLLTEEWDV